MRESSLRRSLRGRPFRYREWRQGMKARGTLSRHLFYDGVYVSVFVATLGLMDNRCDKTEPTVAVVEKLLKH
jgi:hypothetical protein